MHARHSAGGLSADNTDSFHYTYFELYFSLCLLCDYIDCPEMLRRKAYCIDLLVNTFELWSVNCVCWVLFDLEGIFDEYILLVSAEWWLGADTMHSTVADYRWVIIGRPLIKTMEKKHRVEIHVTMWWWECAQCATVFSWNLADVFSHRERDGVVLI